MSDDPNIRAAQYRAREIEAQITQAQARLAENNLYGNEQDSAACIQEIANLSGEKANLVALYNNYVQSQTPPSPPELSAEERAAKPWNRMDYSDVLEMAKGSKYGKDLSWKDQNMQAGYREAMRRKARGE
jgi:hypothetical protein